MSVTVYPEPTSSYTAPNLIRLNAAYVLTSTTSEQKAFDSSANGRLTLTTGTYLFDCVLILTSMSATSGNGRFGLLGAGTATLGAVAMIFSGRDADHTTTIGTVSGGASQTATSTEPMVTVSTATSMAIHVRGTFECTGAGTIVPSIKLTNAAAAQVEIGSYFRCERVGSDSLTTVGSWD